MRGRFGAPLLLLLLVPLFGVGCGANGGGGVDDVRLRVNAVIDATLLARVVVAVVASPTQVCVEASSSRCSELPTAQAARDAAGFVGEQVLDRDSGTTATFSELTHGPACFVAEAFTANDTVLGAGCAEVDLQFERHRVEIELVER